METELTLRGAPGRWMRLAILNLIFVVLAGTFTRYKVTYSLPQIDFKNLLHAHSHFAFSGWASTALFAIIIAFFMDEKIRESKLFSRLFILNQVASYGMLVSFLLQEYGPVSIAFSTLSIFVSYAYVFYIWKYSAKNKKKTSVKALRFALVCLVVSSIGPFLLAYMEVAHVFNLINFSNVVYWYLHFQYNGWFSFAVFAIVLRIVEKKNNGIINHRLNSFLNLMMMACFPIYFVSILWTMPSLGIFILAGLGGLLQLAAVVLLVKEFSVQKSEFRNHVKLPGGRLLYISFLSLVLKLVLQFFCVFPLLNKFVFGHRPAIIGYLHLVLVGFLSFFLIGISLQKGVMNFKHKSSKSGLLIFVIGFLIQEFALLIHGIDNVIMISIPEIPPVLFIAAVMMFLGIAIFAMSQKKTELLH